MWYKCFISHRSLLAKRRRWNLPWRHFHTSRHDDVDLVCHISIVAMCPDLTGTVPVFSLISLCPSFAKVYRNTNRNTQKCDMCHCISRTLVLRRQKWLKYLRIAPKFVELTCWSRCKLHRHFDLSTPHRCYSCLMISYFIQVCTSGITDASGRSCWFLAWPCWSAGLTV